MLTKFYSVGLRLFIQFATANAPFVPRGTIFADVNGNG